MKLTDKQRVESLFRQSEGRLVFLMEIIQGLHIVEYSGRISDVRKDWGCTCGQDSNTCHADEHIVNIKKGYYKYTSSKKIQEPTVSQKLISLQVENRLQKYRMMWTKAKRENNQKEMDRIALMGSTCKLALRTKKDRIVQPQPVSELEQYAREALL